jgi:hypothetical protein
MEVFAIWFEDALLEFQRIMDQVLVGLSFTKCYIDDIIVFSLTLANHMCHLQGVFGRLKERNLKLHPRKCQFFHIHVEYLGHMIYPSGLGVQKVKPFHRSPNQQMLVGYELF